MHECMLAFECRVPAHGERAFVAQISRAREQITARRGRANENLPHNKGASSSLHNRRTEAATFRFWSLFYSRLAGG